LFRKNSNHGFPAISSKHLSKRSILSCQPGKPVLLGSWILVPAFIKYYYTVFTDITGISKMTESKTMFGVVIAVIMFLALILSLILPEKPRIMVALTGTALICISFLYSFLKLT
jgi:hypothetical protein